MKKTFIILPIILCACSGCNSNAPSKPIDIVDLKTCMAHLGETNNFALKVKKENKVVSSFIYADEYVYDELKCSGYLVKDSILYPYSISEDKLTNGEQISDKTLYGTKGVATSFLDVDLSLIDDGIKEISSLKRNIAEPILSIAGFSKSDYLLLDNLNLNINESLDTLSIEFNFKGDGETTDDYFAEINQFDSAKNDIVTKFIKDGEIASIDQDLNRIKSLFASDNYTQIQYDQNNMPFQYDIFNDDYYAVLYSSDFIQDNPLAKAQQVGYLVINEPDKTFDLLHDSEGNPIPLIYDDTFYFQYYGSYDELGTLNLITRDNPKRPGHAQGAFTEQILDIPQAFHYPKGLLMFSQLEKFHDDETIGNYKVKSTNDQEIIKNFLTDYSLNFDDYGGITTLQVLYNLTDTDQDCEVNFRLVTPAGQYYQIDYRNFTSTTFKPFEDLKDKLGVE